MEFILANSNAYLILANLTFYSSLLKFLNEVNFEPIKIILYIFYLKK